MSHTALTIEEGDIATLEEEFKDYHPLLELDPGVIEGEQEHESKSKRKEDVESTTKPTSWAAFLSLEYYQGFFDVTTSEVLYRVLAGMVPVRFSLADAVKKRPDLYGPFWLCMTLIFTAAISGNVGKFFRSGVVWQFHFREVTLMGTVLYAYTWLVPLALWAVMWWRGNQTRYSLLELLSIYGYSVGVFIPVMILWILNVDWLQWLLLCVGAVVSGASLVLAMWTPLKVETKKIALTISCLLFLLHAGLAVGFKFYYFSALASNTTRLGY
eukprot:Em0011g1185a